MEIKGKFDFTTLKLLEATLETCSHMYHIIFYLIFLPYYLVIGVVGDDGFLVSGLLWNGFTVLGHQNDGFTVLFLLSGCRFLR